MQARGFAELDADDAEDWWSALASACREEAAYATEPSLAAAHLAYAARVEADHRGDLEAARVTAAEAHAVDPSGAAPLALLSDLAERALDWPEAARWLKAWADATTDPAERRVALTRLCTVTQDHLHDHAAALPHLRAALQDEPGDRQLLARLELAAGPDDPTARLEVLERRLGLVTEPRRRATLLVEVARIHEQAFEDDGEALRNFRAALSADGASAEALDGVVRLHLRAERWADLVAALMHGFTVVDDDEARGRLLYLCALINVTRLDAPERARLFLGQAALLLGHDPTAVRELVADYEQLGMWGPANTLLEHMADAGGRDEAAAAWYRAGLNAEAGLGQAELAAEAYRKALRADPSFLPALNALRRCAWRADDLEQYVRATEAVAAGAGPQVRAALLTHLGDVAELRLGDAERARQYQGDALRAEIEAAGEAPLGAVAALEARVRLLVAKRNWPVLQEELGGALRRPLAPAAATLVLDALAELEEVELDRPEEAIAHLQALIVVAPDDLRALRGLQRLLGVQRDRAALVTALRREAEGADPARRLALWAEQALAQEGLGRPDEVERCWRGALDLEPTYLPALRGLGRLLYQHGRWVDLAALHEQELETLPTNDPLRVDLLSKLAELHEFRLASADHAATTYEQVLALRPHSPDALAGLERLYGGMERWGELARVLAARAEQLEDAGDRAAVLFRLAELRHEHQGDLDGATEAYETALTLRPDLLPAAWALERLVVARGDRERLVVLYRMLLPRLRSHGQRAVVAHKLAALLPPAEARPLLEELADDGDVDALWGLVRETAELGDRASLAGHLARLAQKVGDRKDAVGLWLEAAECAEDADLPAAERLALWDRVAPLAPEAARPWEARLGLLRARDDREAWAEALVAMARGAADPRARSVGLWAAGLVHLQLDHPVQAADFIEEARAANADDPVPLWLLLDDGRPRRPADRAALTEAAGRGTRHAAQAAGLLTDAGRAFVGLGDEVRGLACLVEAVRRDAGAERAAELAGELLAARHAYAELAALLQRRIRRLDDPEQLAPLLHALADVQLDHLRDRVGACASFARLVELSPDDLDARVRLADLLYSLERHAEAAQHYRAAADRAHDDRVLVRLYTRLGQIKAYQLEDLPGAIEDLRRAVGLLDPDGRALEALAAVYLRGGEAELAALAYQRLEKLAEDPARLAAARAGQVKALVAQGRNAEAVERLKAFREADPVDPLLQTLARDLLHGADISSPALQAELRAQAGEDVAPDVGLLETAAELPALDRPSVPPTVIDDVDLELDQRDVAEPIESDVAELGDPEEPDEAVSAFVDLPEEPRRGPPPMPPPFPPDPESGGPDLFDDAPLFAIDDADLVFDEADDQSSLGGAIDAELERLEAEFFGLEDAPLGGLDPAPEPAPPVPVPAPLAIALDPATPEDAEAPPAVLAPRAGLPRAEDAAPTPAIRPLDPEDAEFVLDGGKDEDFGLLDAFDEVEGPVPGGTRPTSPPVPLRGEPAGGDDTRQTMPYGMPILTATPPPMRAATPSSPPSGQGTETGMPILVPLVPRAAPVPDPTIEAAADSEAFADSEAVVGSEVAADPDALADSVGEQASGLGTLPPALGDEADDTEVPRPSLGATPSFEARAAIEADPLDVNAWRRLLDAMSAGTSGASAAWLGGVVAWVEGEVRPATPSVPVGPLPEAMRRPLLPSSVPTNLLLLLRAVGPSIAPAFGGGGRGRNADQAEDFVPEQSTLHAMARRLAAAIDVPAFRLLRNAARPYTVTVEPEVPATLVLGTAIVDGADDTGRSFLLARCLVPMREGTLPARKLSDREFRAFLGALLGLLGADYPLRPRDRATADRLRSQLQPLVEDHRRPEWDALARAAASGLGTFSPAAVLAGLETYAARLALALSDGFGGAFEMLRLLDFDDRPRESLSREDLEQFLADSEVARDLLIFAGSPACLAVRTWLAGR